MTIKILRGSCLDTLKTLPEQSINTCITSPPYWGLRDYGTAEWEGGNKDCDHKEDKGFNKQNLAALADKYDPQKNPRNPNAYDTGKDVAIPNFKNKCGKCGAVRKDNQLGLEETPEEFVENLVQVFREVKRVLRDDGTVWLNLGDSYSGSGKGPSTSLNKEHHNLERTHSKIVPDNLKPKDLVGIPWRVAFALQADGWYLRQDIIWHKPNPMPESVRDRCTKAHEYIFLLSKSPKYYYDNEAVKEKAVGERWGGNSPINTEKSKDMDNQFSGLTRERKMLYENRNKRSVWTVTTKSFKGAHFATFPPDLIEPCVLAGCPEEVCVECNEPYVMNPLYRYDNETSQNYVSHGKYGDKDTESANRQGLHAERGNKLIEVRENLPKQSVLVSFFKERTSAQTLADNTDIPLTKIEHWFRKDKTGFAYPSIDDWQKVKEFIDDYSEDFYEIDRCLSDFTYKTDAVDSKKIVGYELQKQCDCKTDKTKSGTVLDPFGGSGTTAQVALGNSRDAVLCELNDEYIEIAKQRIAPHGDLFIDIEVI